MKFKFLSFLLFALSIVACSNLYAQVEIHATVTRPVYCDVSWQQGIVTFSVRGVSNYVYRIDYYGIWYSGGSSGENIHIGLDAGLHTIEVRKRDQDSILASIDVEVPFVTGMTLTYEMTDSVHCYGEANGVVTLTASGGDEPYTYSRNSTTTQAENVFSNLVAGTYFFTVRDARGCVETVRMTMPQPMLSLEGVESSPVRCHGESSGEVTLTAYNGNGGYSFKLGDSESNEPWHTHNVYGGLAAGTYTFMVKDARGCEETTTVTVSEPEALTLSYEKTA